MADSKVIILADDLTGANDTAIQFVKQGLSALVIVQPPPVPGLLEGYDVVSVNTESRGREGDAAYRVVQETLAQMGAAQKGCFVYKKVDSVLRGNPGRELAAVMDALDIPLALAAPSFPANRAVLEKGILYAGGHTGSGGEDAVRVFARGTGRETGNIPLEEVRRGARAVAEFVIAHNNGGTGVFVADAVKDEDLETVYRASALLGRPHILAGSAGLAGQLARDLGAAKGCAVAGKPAALSPVLVIAGTRQGETAAQIAALSEAFSVPVIPFKVRLVAGGNTAQAVTAAYAEAAKRIQAQAGLCIIAVESMFRAEVPAGETARDYAEGDDTGAAIAEALGILTGKLFAVFHIPAIISTGGDTSLGICRHLGINGIEPLTEICPGIPLGRIAGGAYHGRFIITKSGRFGKPDALVEIARYLG